MGIQWAGKDLKRQKSQFPQDTYAKIPFCNTDILWIFLFANASNQISNTFLQTQR